MTNISAPKLESIIESEIVQSFRSFSNTPSCTTAKNTLYETINTYANRGNPNLTERQIGLILDSFENSIRKLLVPAPVRGATYLQKPAHDSTIRAIENVRRALLRSKEKEEKMDEPASTGTTDSQMMKADFLNCMHTWDIGGRERTAQLNNSVFKETLREILRPKYINGVTHQNMLLGTYHDPRPSAVPRHANRGWRTQYEFINLSTFDAAKQMIDQGYNPLVLDMANRRDVGGAPGRANAQEENCCRRSDLYTGLQKISKGKLQYHPPIQTGGIYVPNVQVFRKGPEEGYAFHKPFVCAVYASAAYNCKQNHGSGYDKPATNAEYIEGTKQKMRDMFREAYKNGHDSLLLGAFGCGAFQNDPAVISHLYVNVLSEPEFQGLFKKVVFGIIDIGGTQNLQTFKNTFSQARLGQAPVRQEMSCLQRAINCMRRVLNF